MEKHHEFIANIEHLFNRLELGKSYELTIEESKYFRGLYIVGKLWDQKFAAVLDIENCSGGRIFENSVYQKCKELEEKFKLVSKNTRAIRIISEMTPEKKLKYFSSANTKTPEGISIMNDREIYSSYWHVFVVFESFKNWFFRVLGEPTNLRAGSAYKVKIDKVFDGEWMDFFTSQTDYDLFTDFLNAYFEEQPNLTVNRKVKLKPRVKGNFAKALNTIYQDCKTSKIGLEKNTKFLNLIREFISDFSDDSATALYKLMSKK